MCQAFNDSGNVRGEDFARTLEYQIFWPACTGASVLYCGPVDNENAALDLMADIVNAANYKQAERIVATAALPVRLTYAPDYFEGEPGERAIEISAGGYVVCFMEAKWVQEIPEELWRTLK